MKADRCIKKPFDYKSWCGRDTRGDMLPFDSESFLMNLICEVENLSKRKVYTCKECINNLNHLINANNNTMEGSNETKIR